MTAEGAVERRRLVVGGTVQGVGFRPFVYVLAHAEQLTGHVLNDGLGVTIELQGPAARLDRFAARLASELPPPGSVERLESEAIAPIAGEEAFTIRQSQSGAGRSVSLAPDLYTCPACLTELADPGDRRHRYPFTNCTHCGPRYTITRALPYDRPNTTMAAFVLCSDCEREYRDPFDRRYHAQPVACPVCGPRVWLAAPGAGATPPPATADADPAAPVDAARAHLEAGETVAIKGIGGFHLAVNARDPAAVARLRGQKARGTKPLAIMVRDAAVAARVVHLDAAAEELLTAPAAPIVIAPARADHGLAPDLAPGLSDLGVMLPYSPLHHLLFGAGLDALVMTSGNHPSEPITTENRDALAGLPADRYLLHDRPIRVACDDSVVRTGPRGPMFIRRSRGYVPRALDARQLPRRRVLALGAFLKVTIATLDRGELIVGRHLGDLDNPRAEAAFADEIARMLAFAEIAPEVVAVDLHPDLFSVHHAAAAFGERAHVLGVQHHHAHLAAVMVEHGLGPDDQVVGVILDGFGYAPDGTIWGGEVLQGGYGDARRVGWLRPVPQPGGDAAAREPGRMATSLLGAAGITRHPAYDARVATICGSRALAPLTSSAGRLFDGVAAILGAAPAVQGYEGEAPARLEALAAPAVAAGCTEAYPLPCGADGELDTPALVAALVADDAAAPAVRAARFHHGLADGLAAAALRAGAARVVLGGGACVNRLLTARLAAQLEAGGADVLLPRALPAGDGGLAAGQAAIAACSALS